MIDTFKLQNLIAPLLFGVHLAIIVGGIFMGLVLPLWLVAGMVAGHRLHLYIFDGCVFSKLQQKMGMLSHDKNFLQDAAAVLFKKDLNLEQVAKIDNYLVNSSVVVASLVTLIKAQSLVDVALILAILAGLSISWRMIVKAKTPSPAVCKVGGVCQEVKESEYSHLFGIKAEVLGVIYFASMLMIYGLLDLGLISSSLFVASAIIGALFSAYFLFVQAVKIKQFCKSCVKAHAVSFSLLGLIYLAIV